MPSQSGSRTLATHFAVSNDVQARALLVSDCEQRRVVLSLLQPLGCNSPKLLGTNSRWETAGEFCAIDHQSGCGQLPTSVVAKVFDRLVEAIHAEMGGSDQLSAMEGRLIDAFCGASVVQNHLNAKILSGTAIDVATVAMHAQAVSAMVRVARWLGVGGRARPVMDLDTFLAMRRRERSEPPEGSIE